MENIFGDTYFNSIGKYLKNEFGTRIIKLSLEGGFTCPNRDGSKGTGGCIYCSSQGSGDFAGDIPSQIQLLSKKWPEGKYIAYFQSHTNTYAPTEILREKFYSALDGTDIIGLAIATRPDCISEETYELLAELNKKTFLWIELGLQTANDETAKLINRCYPLSVFEKAINRLNNMNIKTVVHLIFGLPGEDKSQILTSLKYVCGKSPFGLKLHMLNVIKGSQMENLYKDFIPFDCISDYVNLVVDALEIIPQDITIHRLTADAKRSILIAPEWSYKKRTILNSIHNELKSRGSFQGCKL